MASDAGVPRKQGSTRALVALLAFVLGFATVPHRVMEREADQWFAGDPVKTDALAAGVARWTTSGELAPATFATGSSRFNGEWHFATYMMAAMGFGQTAAVRPVGERDESIARMEHCLDAMLDPAVRSFDGKAWGSDALASLEALPGSAEDRGHVAYLGYAAVALSLHRVLVPSSRFVEREEAILHALARRIDASPTGLVETYPGEVYPVDNTAALAALTLHAHATKQPAPPALARGLEAVRRKGVDPTTGLLFQAVTATDANPRDLPRASGTALAAYFLAFADGTTSRSLFHALERSQFRTVLGFGGMMEYPPGRRAGRGDVDSGPVFLGFGVSASGFAIGASRAHGDRETFTALYATAQLFGAPLDEDGTRTYATGGPIGDAILFAMLTAPRIGRFA
ncbi:MAG: putative hydrolase [Labilithrix sp.]|nr:putative hydrolase [Labilithrix sp.]